MTTSTPSPEMDVLAQSKADMLELHRLKEAVVEAAKAVWVNEEDDYARRFDLHAALFWATDALIEFESKEAE